MYFVPEGQHDSSQARSAWSHEENSPVPAGRLNGSRHRLDANITFQQGYLAFPSGTSIRRAVARSCRDSVSRTNISGTDNDFGHPSGTELSASLPGTSCLATLSCPSGTKSPLPNPASLAISRQPLECRRPRHRPGQSNGLAPAR
jgi:hypothetical protein